MRRLFDPDTPVIQVASKVATLLWMNVLWFLCCLPLITIGASTAALCRMMFNLRQEKSCTAKFFFRVFAENFWKATGLFFMLLVFYALLYGYYYGVCHVANRIIQVLLLSGFCALFLLGGFTAVYVFPLTAYFKNTVRNTVRNALVISLTHYRQTVTVFALTLLPVLAFILSPYWFLRLGYVWVLIAPCFLAYWSAAPLLKVFESCANAVNGGQ